MSERPKTRASNTDKHPGLAVAKATRRSSAEVAAEKKKKAEEKGKKKAVTSEGIKKLARMEAIQEEKEAEDDETAVQPPTRPAVRKQVPVNAGQLKASDVHLVGRNLPLSSILKSHAYQPWRKRNPDQKRTRHQSSNRNRRKVKVTHEHCLRMLELQLTQRQMWRPVMVEISVSQLVPFSLENGKRQLLSQKCWDSPLV